MRTEDLPDWRDCDLQDDIVDPPMPLNALQKLIFKHTPPDPFIDCFREDLAAALTENEDNIRDKILKRLVVMAKQYEVNGFTHNLVMLKLIVSEVEQLLSTESLMKNGHLCGIMCDVCKPHIEDE